MPSSRRKVVEISVKVHSKTIKPKGQSGSVASQRVAQPPPSLPPKRKKSFEEELEEWVEEQMKELKRKSQ